MERFHDRENLIQQNIEDFNLKATNFLIFDSTIFLLISQRNERITINIRRVATDIDIPIFHQSIHSNCYLFSIYDNLNYL